MVETQGRPGGAEVVRAYAASELGRATLRRELVEGAEIRAGDQVLILCEIAPPGGMEAIVKSAADIVRDLGAEVALLHVDELIPIRHGTAQGAWMDVEKLHLPRALHAAILASDVVLDYTVNSRGGQKYNQDFYALGMYYGKRICSYRAVEAPEALSRDPSAPVAYPDALSYPSDLLRIISLQVSGSLIDAAEAGKVFRLTNPWGTDLRLTVLPGDVSSPFGGIRLHPSSDRFDFAADDSRRLWRTLVGFAVTQTCEGIWVTRHCSLLGGELRQPHTFHFKDGFIVGVDGELGSQVMDKIKDDPAGVHAILMGLNPKATPFREGRYLHNNNGAGVGVCHLALGGPGMFYRKGEWGGVGNQHFQLGNIPKISLWAGDEVIVRDGYLEALRHPRVIEEARRFGDPAELLRQYDWPVDVPI